MSHSSRSFLLSPVGLSLAIAATATTARADLDISRQISVESNNFTGSASTAELATTPEELNEFSADFSMLEDEPLSISWEAPPGKMIEITRPAGFSGTFTLEFILTAGTVSQPDVIEETDPDVVYSGLDGDIPTAGTRSVLLSDAAEEGIEATITDSLAPGESVKFRSLTASLTVDNSYDEDFDNVDLTGFLLRGTANTTGMDAPTDPGQWIRLVDEEAELVPEEIDPVVARKAKLKRSIKKLKKRIKIARRAGQPGKVRSLRKQLRAKKKTLRAL